MKHKSTTILFAVLSLSLSLYGCGGAGGGFTTAGSGQGPGSSSERVQTFGGLTTRVAGTAQPPVTAQGAGVVVTGIAGGNVSSLTLDGRAPSLSETQILFTRPDGDGFQHIFAMKPDGTGLRQITHGPGSDHDPCWSPDSTKIAYGHDDAGAYYRDLVFCNADGTGAKKIYSEHEFMRDVAWSPDGAKIAFTRLSNGLSSTSLAVINPDGSGFTPFAPSHLNESQPSWSPDSRKLVFAANNTSLRFAQNADWLPVTVIDGPGVSALSAVTGAIVDYDAYSGKITAILPYSASRAAENATRVENGARIHRGHFLGVWDASGKNQAPNGASEVRADLKTGRVLSIK